MGTKGSWQRPGDARAWDDNYRRIFRQKEQPNMARKKVRTMPIHEIEAKVNKIAAQLDEIYVHQIENANEDRIEKMRARGLYHGTFLYLRNVVSDLSEAVRP